MRMMHRFGVYSVIGAISIMSLLLLPAMIGLLADDSALTEPQAGWSASINFFGAALIAMVMAFRMHHLHLRQVAMLGFALAAMSDFAAAFYLDQPTFFMTIRFVSGLGSGAAYTAVLASFARSPDMDRGYGMFVTLQFIVSGLGLYALPVFSDQLGASGLFMGLAGLEVLGLAVSAAGRRSRSCWLQPPSPARWVLPCLKQAILPSSRTWRDWPLPSHFLTSKQGWP